MGWGVEISPTVAICKPLLKSCTRVTPSAKPAGAVASCETTDPLPPCKLTEKRQNMAGHVSVTDVDAAAKRLKQYIHRTPLLESIALNNLTGARILVKVSSDEAAVRSPVLKYSVSIPGGVLAEGRVFQDQGRDEPSAVFESGGEEEGCGCVQQRQLRARLGRLPSCTRARS